MTHYGLQTIDFLGRLQKFEQELPPLLLEMAQLVKQMIDAIEAQPGSGSSDSSAGRSSAT